jgi:hypothetical protein
VAPSRKVTVPVGVAPLPAAVAVNVIEAWKGIVLTDADRATVGEDICATVNVAVVTGLFTSPAAAANAWIVVVLATEIGAV